VTDMVMKNANEIYDVRGRFSAEQQKSCITLYKGQRTSPQRLCCFKHQ